MTQDDIQQHENAWKQVWNLLFTAQNGMTMRQAKDAAERVIRPLGCSNIAYLMGQAIDLMPKDQNGAARRMELACEQIDLFKRHA